MLERVRPAQAAGAGRREVSTQSAETQGRKGDITCH